MKINELKNGFAYCMHGLGAIKGLRQTNTREAFELWYGRGIRVFEFDIAKTDDDKYVAVAHTVDKKSMFRMEITEEPSEYTYDWFMNQKLFPLTTKGLSPLSLEMILDLLRKHKDCVFMLDLFGMFAASELNPFLAELDKLINGERESDRLLLEAYNTCMSDAIAVFNRDYNIIYCVRYEGNTDIANAVSIKYLKDLDIKCVSYPWIYTNAFPGELKRYSDAGFTVFSRTKYNTKPGLLISTGVSVNIVGYVFNGAWILLQYPAYIAECAKRIVSKIRLSR